VGGIIGHESFAKFHNPGTKSNNGRIQAGAELCQAQVKLGLTKPGQLSNTQHPTPSPTHPSPPGLSQQSDKEKGNVHVDDEENSVVVVSITTHKANL
jgi:hypothetical protein